MGTQQLDAKLRDLIEADLNSLLERDSLSFNEGDPVDLYARALLAYRQGNLALLEELALELKRRTLENPDYHPAYVLSVARIAIRSRSVDSGRLTEVFKLADTKGPWQGEACFVSGLALEAAEEHLQSMRYYQTASKVFQAQDCPRKSLKAFLNAVSADSRAHMDKKLLNDYHFIFRKAEKLGDASIAGIALVNLSREYQKLGARSVALKWASRAIEILESEFGGIQYELALAHRCHLLLELDRKLEAETDYEAIRHSAFPEVMAALEVIDALRGSPSSPHAAETPNKAFLPTWKERRTEVKAVALTDLEQKLLACLADGPKNKYDIIETLYGDKLAPDAAENRFNNLLSRIRKKLPGVVILQDAKYEIVDEALKRIAT